MGLSGLRPGQVVVRIDAVAGMVGVLGVVALEVLAIGRD